MFSLIKKTNLFIINDILQKITKQKSISFENLNINKVFKGAKANFLHMGKFTYTKAKFANYTIFNAIKYTKLNIIFSQNNQYIVLCLKTDKNNIKNTKVEIIITVTNNFTYPVLTF